MKIAIIGGGASGIITAYLLAERHDIHLFERSAQLGGNVRTLNRNVLCGRLSPGEFCENGAYAFHPPTYPLFCRLLDQLGIEPRRGNFLKSGLFLRSGRHYLSLSPAMLRSETVSRAAAQLMRYPLLGPGLASVGLASSLYFMMGKGRRRVHREQTIAAFLPRPRFAFDKWRRAALMLTFSTPYHAIDRLPAQLGVDFFMSTLTPFWSVIPGGMSRYQERILELVGSRVAAHVSTEIAGIERDPRGVTLRFANGDERRYDKVVLATTPGRVLPLLRDASEAERRRFGAWRASQITTTAHCDLTMYQRYGVNTYSFADYFERANGDFGYNSYLNDGYGLPATSPYSYAYNLDDQIRPQTVLERFRHTTPRYTVEAMRGRTEVIETNGSNHTFHAGAYLGDGLHEGAVRSALDVSRRLGDG